MKKRFVAKICNLIGILLMLSVIVFMVPLTVPKLFGWHIYGVLTGSMEPAYSVGSVVYIQPCEPGQVNVGDVITFRMGTDTGYVMTHRVVEIDREAGVFTTKGDANDVADPEPVAFDRLLGRVTFSVPGLVRVSDFVNSTTGRAVLFSMFALSFILWVAADMLAPKRRIRGRVQKETKTNEQMTEGGMPDIQPAGTAEDRMRKQGRGVLRICLRILGAVLIIGASVYLGGIFLQYQKGEAEYTALEKQVFGAENADAVQHGDSGEGVPHGMSEEGSEADMKILEAVLDLQKQNEDVIGWITFDNMELSYPVMQGEDNSYYLSHTFSGEKNSAGSIFMEAANNPDFDDCHTILYGHNMKNLSMFGQLRKYKTEEFYEGHQYFTIYTTDQVYRYQVFAYYDISELGDVYTVGFEANEEFGTFVGRMQERSYYDTGVEVTAQDKVITLSTCSTEGNRFVVHAKRIGR